MKRLRAKMRRLKLTTWNQLTLGEKIAKVIISLVKTSLIVAVVGCGAAVVLGAAVGIFVAFAIVSAISGGLADASRAYRPGDQYVRWF